MPIQDADEDFEFLVNLLASDGVESEAPPRAGATGSREGKDDDGRGVKIQRGSDGKLDLGQVKAFYENKKMGVGKGVGVGRGVGMTGDPGMADQSRNHPGLHERCFFFPARTLKLSVYCGLPWPVPSCHVLDICRDANLYRP